MNEIWDKVTDFLNKVSKKNEELTQYIYERTGTKINVGMIILCVVLVIFVLSLAKMALSTLWGKLL